MTKKFLFASAVALSMLTLASCSSDDDLMPAGDGNTVTFTAQLPGNLTSRAFSDGTKVSTLKYAVYLNGEDKLIVKDGDEGAPVAKYDDATKTFTVSFQLAKGKKYDFAFWAQCDEADAPYTFNATDEGVTVDMNYDTDATANNEARDAFFNVATAVGIEGAAQRSIMLHRPFGRLNICTSDYEAWQNSVSVKELGDITVKVKNVFNTLDLFSGEAKDPIDEVTFTGVRPTTDADEIFNVGDDKTYTYLAMDYVLTGEDVTEDVNHAQQETKDVNILVTDKLGNRLCEIPVSAAPFQRNYKTNIYGALLTAPLDYIIKVEPEFEIPDYNIEQVEEGKVVLKAAAGDQKFESIAAAIAAAKAAGMTDVNLVLGKGTFAADDINNAANAITNLSIAGQGEATIINKPNKDNAISKVNIKFTSVKIVSNYQTYNGFQHNASETYQGCIIEKQLFLYGPAKFENCIFRNDANYNVWIYGSKTAEFKSCSFGTYGKSVLFYNEGTTQTMTATFDGCTFNGGSIKDSKAAIEVDCMYVKDGGLFTVNINNCKVNGYDTGLLSGNNLWNVKKGTRFVVNVDGKQQTQGMTTDGANAYWVNNADGLVTLSRLVNGYYKDAELAHELFSGKTVTLTADIDMAGVDFAPIGAGMDANPSRNFHGTFDGKNHTISNLTASDSRKNWAAAGLFGGFCGVVKDLTLRNVNISSSHYAGGVVGYIDDETGALIDNCKVIGGTITSTPEDLGTEWDNGDKAGGILGYGCIGKDKVTNCTAENLTIKAYRHFGSIVGFASNPANVTGNTAKNITLLWDNSHDYKNFGTIASVPFGSIIGNSKELGSNTAENVTLPQ